MKDVDVSKWDLTFYRAPDPQEMRQKNILEFYFFGHYKEWTPQENFYYAAEHTNFEPNPERSEGTYSKYASLDDKMDGFHYYMRYIKFGLGRCMEDAAHEIRDGHITREEGIALMDRFEGEFPQKYYQDFLDYLGIDENHFRQVVDSWRLDHIWENTPSGWVLRHQIK